jgi:membrane-associated protein
MEFEDFLEDYGYGALFLSLCLGLFGFPAPNEAIVMTGAAVTTRGMLQPVPAFIATYLGICSGLTFGYVVGKIFGSPLFERLKRKPGIELAILRTERLLNKYGSYTLLFSFFIPVVRHVIPYVLSSNKMSFFRFAPFAYTGGLIWTIVYFFAGRIVTDIAV